jgi:hypothetical protein
VHQKASSFPTVLPETYGQAQRGCIWLVWRQLFLPQPGHRSPWRGTRVGTIFARDGRLKGTLADDSWWGWVNSRMTTFQHGGG